MAVYRIVESSVEVNTYEIEAASAGAALARLETGDERPVENRIKASEIESVTLLSPHAA